VHLSSFHHWKWARVHQSQSCERPQTHQVSRERASQAFQDSLVMNHQVMLIFLYAHLSTTTTKKAKKMHPKKKKLMQGNSNE